MKVICQYTGIEFDATSPRQKNHPQVSVLLREAHAAGTDVYAAVKQRLADARARGMTDIDEIISVCSEGVGGVRTVAPETRTCWECGRVFTYAECRRWGGVWRESYCGC